MVKPEKTLYLLLLSGEEPVAEVEVEADQVRRSTVPQHRLGMGVRAAQRVLSSCCRAVTHWWRESEAAWRMRKMPLKKTTEV